MVQLETDPRPLSRLFWAHCSSDGIARRIWFDAKLRLPGDQAAIELEVNLPVEMHPTSRYVVKIADPAPVD